MRTLSATQLAAQTSSGREPYVKVEFDDGTTQYDYTTRVLKIYYYEGMFGGKGAVADYHSAVIYLNNSDGNVADLTEDFYVDTEWGDVTGVGNEAAEYPRLFVVAQVGASRPGSKVSVVYLDDTFLRLGKEPVDHLGSAPYWYYQYDRTTTPYDILDAALTEEGYTLDALAEDDGIIDTFLPQLEINKQPYMTVLDLISQCMQTSKSYIRAQPDLHFEIKFPQETDTIDETFYTVQADGTPVARSYYSRENKVVPNKVVVFCNQSTNGDWDDIIIGSTFTGNGDIPVYFREGSINTQADADKFSAAILTKIRAITKSSYFVCNHDARIEIGDYITVSDGR